MVNLTNTKRISNTFVKIRQRNNIYNVYNRVTDDEYKTKNLLPGDSISSGIKSNWNSSNRKCRKRKTRILPESLGFQYL